MPVGREHAEDARLSLARKHCIIFCGFVPLSFEDGGCTFPQDYAVFAESDMRHKVINF